jgi:hypothetical protein
MYSWEYINTDYLYMVPHKFFSFLLQYTMVAQQETLSTEMDPDRQVQVSVDLVLLSRFCRLRNV